MTPSIIRASRGILLFIEVIVLTLLLPSALYPTQVSGKSYKILLSNGREISCSHYYERNGQIIVVRPIGEIGYNKDEVVEIREESTVSTAPAIGPAASRVPSSKPAASSGTGQCRITDLWFRAELNNAGPAKLNELIAQEQAKIAELERQLPSLIASDEAGKAEQKRTLAASREGRRNTPPQNRYETTGEDVIARSQQASGTASVVQGGLKGGVTFEDATPAKRKLMERELSQHQCNLYWTEKKLSGTPSR